MKLVAIVRPPADPAAVVKVLCEVAGFAPAEARMRLAGEPPLVLARLEEDAAQSLLARLQACGCPALAIDPDPPGDRDRFLVRSLEFLPDGVVFQPRAGAPLRLAAADFRLLLRGIAIGHEAQIRTETERKFSLGKAILTQGLMLTKTEKKEVRVEAETSDQFLLVYAEGGTAAVLYESEVAFTCLGPQIQPSRLANLNLVTQTLRALAPTARFDDRLLRMARRGGPFAPGRGPDVVADLLWRSLALGLW